MRRVSAVIVTFNNAAMLKCLLEDLYAQSRMPDEIIVVDNASKDGTTELVTEEFPDVRYLRLAENTGSAGGYHKGIETALPNSDFIWTLDDDVQLRSDALEQLLKGFDGLSKTHSSIGAVRSVGEYRPKDPPSRLHLFPWRGTLLRADVVRMLGLPRNDFFIYGEDLEYAMRFNASGFHCYWIPSSVCTEMRTNDKNDYALAGLSLRVYPRSFQLYYAFRNNLYVFMEYRDSYRFIRTMLYAVKASLFLLFFERTSAVKKIVAIGTGLFHGLQGKLGENAGYPP